MMEIWISVRIWKGNGWLRGRGLEEDDETC